LPKEIERKLKKREEHEAKIRMMEQQKKELEELDLKMKQVEQKKKEAKRKRQMEEAQISNHKKITEKLKEMNKKEFMIKEHLHKRQFDKLKEAETKSIIISRKIRKTQEYNENLQNTKRKNFLEKQIYLDEVKSSFERKKKKELEEYKMRNTRKEENVHHILV